MTFSPLLHRRLTAYFIDLCVVLVLAIACLVAVVSLYGLWRYAGDEALIKAMLASEETKLFAQVSHAALLFSYFTIAHWYFGRTVGKWAVGIQVTSHGHSISFTRSAIRSFGYFLSGSVTFGIGFLFPLFRKDGRALHDLMAGTDVSYVRKNAVQATLEDKSRAA